jgi:transcriptional regulator with XRE-family HTH domain
MGLLQRFGVGLQRARARRGLTQEDFDVVSSRTYLSSLERGLKAPTITKLEELASVIDVHPLALFAMAYISSDLRERDKFFAELRADVELLYPLDLDDHIQAVPSPSGGNRSRHLNRDR